MAPDPESVYFPLEKCLNGDDSILSWKTAFYAITNEDYDSLDPETTVRSFFADSKVTSLLSRPFDAFQSPSAQTKASFEQKTSAINVTPSAKPRYNLKQIKEDALWLSEAVSVDEVSALRVAVVECQNRTSAQLLSPFSEEESAGIREAAGNTKYSSAIPLSLLSQAVDVEETKAAFETQNARRRRILSTYLLERNSFLATYNNLLQSTRSFQARDTNGGNSKQPAVPATWLETLGLDLLKQIGAENTILHRSFDSIKQCVQSFEQGCKCFPDEAEKEDVELQWARGHLTQIVHTMEIAFDTIVSSRYVSSSKAVLEWLQLATSYNFFNTLETEDPTVQALFLVLQSLTALISLAILRIGHTIDYLSEPENEVRFVNAAAGDEEYFLNKEVIYKIQALMLNVAEENIPIVTAGPALLGWSALVRFLQVRVADTRLQLEQDDADDHIPTVEYEDVIEQIMDKDVEDPIDFVALKAVNDCRAFDTVSGLAQRLGSTSEAYFSPLVGARMRLVLLELIQHTTMVGYIPEVIEAVVAVLRAGQDYWNNVDSIQLPAALDPTRVFFEHETLVKAFLQNATSRFPFESAPLLQLVHALAASSSSYQDVETHPILDFMETLPVFTYQLAEDFVGYETIQEEDNNNNIQLLQPVELFTPRTKAISYRTQKPSLAMTVVDHDFSIQARTHGRILSDSGPRIVFWYHKYSGLKYLGKLLETFLTASNIVDATTDAPAERDQVSEIIDILASLVFGISTSGSLSDTAKQDSLRVLETASSGLSRNRDIITVVFDIFEEELQRISANMGSNLSLDVLVSCVHFMHALLPICPRRVWPLLAQSKLLDTGRGGGRLAVIVEGVELVTGQYEFLIACSRLYEAVVDELATNTVRRKIGGKSTGRYLEGNDYETGISDQILSKTLLVFTKYFVDFLESSCTWKFLIADERRQLTKTVTTTFDRVLQYSFGLVLESEESAQHLLGNLTTAASVIVETLLSSTSGTLRFQPLLRSYYEGLETPTATGFQSATALWITHVNSVLRFSSTLLRVDTLLGRQASQLETQIFNASPLIARLYGMHESYQKPALDVFEALILAASSHSAEPPSLLAHLGPQTSKNFIQLLSDLDKPLSRTRHASSIWNFLSVVVSNRQQWFSNYLLTGKTPKAALQKETSNQDAVILDRPFLATVLTHLTNLKNLDPAQALAMLRFIALAQNFWPWTVYSSDKYDTFVRALLTFAGELKPVQNAKSPLDAIFQTRIAAYIGEIVAMYLFHGRQTGVTIDFAVVQSNLEYFTRFAAEAPTYNTSLHKNLKHNFINRYNGCKIQDFQRTGLSARELGKDYFYDRILAENMLSFDEAWSGKRGKRDDGLRNDVVLANLNLSMVDAQIAMFQSWKFLAIELSSKLSSEIKLQEMLAKVANACLITNSKNQPSEEIFASLSQTRAELALVLAKRLVQVGSTHDETKRLINNVWDNIRTLRGSFDHILVGSEIEYYRTLLKLLFLALRVHAAPENGSESLRSSILSPGSSAFIPMLLDIVKHVVASGLRELASSLHSATTSTDSTSQPEDLSLLTGILQTILRIPQVELNSATLVNIFTAASTVRIATTLFSWSDTLAVNGDPIYGELSMLFLLELSSIQPMAEQMAIEGVLGQIAAANITSYLQRGPVGPFVDSSGAQRCYSIWVRGILPFLLNLLDSVQMPISAEISSFLSAFPALLAQSTQAFETPETNRLLAKGQNKFITLSSCSEIHSLSLITYILNGFKSQTGGEGIVDLGWDAPAVNENVEWWLASREVLRERIVPMGEREVDLSRRKGKNGQASELEEKVVGELLGVRDVLGASQ